MSHVSNARGIVSVEDGFAVGWQCNGDDVHEIGRLPLPLSRADAEMMIHLSLNSDGKFDRPIGVTSEMFIRHHLMVAD